MKKLAPRLIADVPAWLTAGLADMPHGFRALLVYVSTLVEETDPVYRPVVEYLESHCHRLDSVDRAEDRSMMFGSADQLIYSIWPECPGSLVAHGCSR